MRARGYAGAAPAPEVVPTVAVPTVAEPEEATPVTAGGLTPLSGNVPAGEVPQGTVFDPDPQPVDEVAGSAEGRAATER